MHLSSEAHHLWRESQEPGKRIGQELPGKQEADGRRPSVVRARAPAPQPSQELHRDLHPREPCRVGPTVGPVDPRHALVGAG